MKKLILVAAAMLVGCYAYAQKIGVIGGLTSTNSNIVSAAKEVKDITQFHLGVTARVKLPLGFAVQPSLQYNIKGVDFSQNIDDAVSSINMKTGFIELPVQLQYGFNLLGFKPYLFLEPFVGCAVNNIVTEKSGKERDTNTGWDNIKNRIEYGLGAGAGVELFSRLQVSVRYFWNLGELYNSEFTDGTSLGTATIHALSSITKQKCGGIAASVAVFF